ncbi:hypothetical protein IZY60_12725 [Lutibacter sp. B2]|nr:hypothetical protein [Lutibacter sp. B2]
MQLRKKAISFVLTVAMVLGMFPTIPGLATQEVEAKSIQSDAAKNVKMYAERTKEDIENLAGTSLTSVGNVTDWGMSLELWHYSGGYWGYEVGKKRVQIPDNKFKQTGGGVADLEDALKLNPYPFRYEIVEGSALDTAIRAGDEIYLNIKANKKEAPLQDLYALETQWDKKLEEEVVATNEDGTVKSKGAGSNLETGARAEVVYDKASDTYFIELTARPKLNFYPYDVVNYNDTYELNLDKHIPFVKNDFGFQLYSMWPQSGNQAAIGWFNADDPYSLDGMPEGRVHPTMIRPYNHVDALGGNAGKTNNGGLLYEKTPLYYTNSDGAILAGSVKNQNGDPITKDLKVKILNKKGESFVSPTKYNIGSGTFSNGGAVGLRFEFPVQITAYAKPAAKVIKSYVRVAGVKADGTLEYETLSETVVEDAKFDENGNVKILKVDELKEGDAYLNDVITSPKTLQPIKEVEWKEQTPKGKIDDIRPMAEDISSYTFGILTKEEAVISAALKVEGGDAEKVREIQMEIDKFANGIVNYFSIPSDMNLVIHDSHAITDISTIKISGGTGVEGGEEGLKLAEQGGSSDILAGLNNAQKGVTGSQELNPTKASPSVEIGTDEIENKKAAPSVEIGSYEIENKKANIVKSIPKVLYLRYIVIPKRTQHNRITLKKDGVEVLSIYLYNRLPLAMDALGTLDLTTNLLDVRTVYPDLKDVKLVSWHTSDINPIPDNLADALPPKVSGGLNSGPNPTMPVVIKNAPINHNIYVQWEIETYTIGKAPMVGKVEEWRLSRYTAQLPEWRKAMMSLKLHSDHGCAGTSFSPSGTYNYFTVNPNKQRTDLGYNPDNMRYKTWLHSKALTKGSYSVSHGKPFVAVDVTGDLNLIKSTAETQINAASWVANQTVRNDLAKHNIVSSTKGVPFAGADILDKKEILEYGIENKDVYNHDYGVRKHKKGDCLCYTRPETPRPNYLTADFELQALIERYKQVSTDARILKSAPTKVESNGKTAIAMQETGKGTSKLEVAVVEALEL